MLLVARNQQVTVHLLVKVTLCVHYPEHYPDVLPDISLLPEGDDFLETDITDLIESLKNVVRTNYRVALGAKLTFTRAKKIWAWP